MGQVNEAQGRRRGLGLWRLLPFAGLVLLVAGNVRFGLGGRDAADDAQIAAMSALVLAVFFNAYGPEGQAKHEGRVDAGEQARLARATSFGLNLALAVAVLGALIFSAGPWLRVPAPARPEDWRLLAFDLLAITAYGRLFHLLWTGRPRPPEQP